MPSAKDVTISSEFVKVFVVGVPGSGKSYFAASFPTPGFIFDFSSGILLYRGLDFDYEQYPMGPQGWVKFEKDCLFIEKKVATGCDIPERDWKTKGKFATVIVDDLTAMQLVCMERALQLDPKRNPAGGPMWNVHFQMVRNLMEGKLRRIIDLPCNIVFIAHMDIITDKESGETLAIEPLLVGQLSKIMPGYFDEVYFTTTKREGGENKWYVQTVPIGMKQARSRLSGRDRLLPDFFQNDYPELMKHIITSKKAPTKKEKMTNG